MLNKLKLLSIFIFLNAFGSAQDAGPSNSGVATGSGFDGLYNKIRASEHPEDMVFCAQLLRFFVQGLKIKSGKVDYVYSTGNERVGLVVDNTASLSNKIANLKQLYLLAIEKGFGLDYIYRSLELSYAQEETLLHIAVKEKSPEALDAFLSECPNRIKVLSSLNRTHQTPLTLCLQEGSNCDPRIVSCLIRHGADPEEGLRYSIDALTVFVHIRYGYSRHLFRYFLKNGALGDETFMKLLSKIQDTNREDKAFYDEFWAINRGSDIELKEAAYAYKMFVNLKKKDSSSLENVLRLMIGYLKIEGLSTAERFDYLKKRYDGLASPRMEEHMGVLKEALKRINVVIKAGPHLLEKY